MAITDTHLFRGYDGVLVDKLLASCLLEEGYEGRPLIESLLRAIRSGRPRSEYVWPSEADHLLAEAVSRCSSDETAARSLLLDVSALIEGKKSSLQIARERGPMRDVGVPNSIELAEFRTSNSFSEAKELFKQHMTDKEPLEVVIRGHLWVEASVIRLIDRALRVPSALEDARLSFAQRVQLARALGAVSDEEARVISKLNRIRNRVAHTLGADITETDQRELLQQASPDLLYIAGASNEDVFPLGLEKLISAIVIVLHGYADEIDAQSRYTEFLHARVQAVLGP